MQYLINILVLEFDFGLVSVLSNLKQHKGTVTRQMLPFEDVIMFNSYV